MRALAPAFAAGLAMLAVAATGRAAGVAGVTAPLAASVALLAGSAALPSARPRALGGGYAVGAIAGVLAATVLGTGIAATAAATALALGAMQRTRTLHPPAVAAACAVALAPATPWHLAAGLAAGGLALAAWATLARRPSPAPDTPKVVPVPLPVSPSRWPRTRVTELLGIDHPIVLGPFGGGLSSTALVAAVSESGGLGSFGVHHLEPAAIEALAGELRAATVRPFALNLWVSNHDLPEAEMTPERYAAAVARLQALYDEVGADPPPYPERFAPVFEEQAEAILAARPAAFSFVFGVPDDRLLAAFRERGIATIGTATTPDEAVALDQAGVDAIVASGAEAGGHRGAFLAPAEDSLVGTLPLVRIAAGEVRAPVIAAGGIADAHGIAAALALGAEGVQIGTAFLATDESAATAEHRAALRGPNARRTRLTRVYSGRLARGIPNRLVDELAVDGAIEPYPYQGYLLKPIADAARAQGRIDVVALWSGQAAALVEHTQARQLYSALVAGTERLLAANGPAPPDAVR